MLIETLIKRSSMLNINDMQEYCIRKKKLFKFNLKFDFNDLLKGIICPLHVCECNIKDYAIKRFSRHLFSFRNFLWNTNSSFPYNNKLMMATDIKQDFMLIDFIQSYTVNIVHNALTFQILLLSIFVFSLVLISLH